MLPTFGALPGLVTSKICTPFWSSETTIALPPLTYIMLMLGRPGMSIFPIGETPGDSGDCAPATDEDSDGVEASALLAALDDSEVAALDGSEVAALDDAEVAVAVGALLLPAATLVVLPEVPL